jgi:hypothetical protein
LLAYDPGPLDGVSVDWGHAPVPSSEFIFSIANIAKNSDMNAGFDRIDKREAAR